MIVHSSATVSMELKKRKGKSTSHDYKPRERGTAASKDGSHSFNHRTKIIFWCSVAIIVGGWECEDADFYYTGAQSSSLQPSLSRQTRPNLPSCWPECLLFDQ